MRRHEVIVATTADLTEIAAEDASGVIAAAVTAFERAALVLISTVGIELRWNADDTPDTVISFFLCFAG